MRRGLRALRATVGLSQLAVSEQLGIPEKRYWRIENGYEQPSPSERARLAKALRVDESALGFEVATERAAS